MLLELSGEEVAAIIEALKRADYETPPQQDARGRMFETPRVMQWRRIQEKLASELKTPRAY